VVLAGFEVTAGLRGAAVLDRRHDLELGEAQVSCMVGPVGGPCSAEDVGDLDRGAHGSAAAKFVERARDGANRPGRVLGVKGGVVELGVPEQDVDDPDVGGSSRRRVAKLWRRVCSPTRLAMSAAFAASTTTR
jgi:hypothetical protein